MLLTYIFNRLVFFGSSQRGTVVKHSGGKRPSTKLQLKTKQRAKPNQQDYLSQELEENINTSYSREDVKMYIGHRYYLQHLNVTNLIFKVQLLYYDSKITIFSFMNNCWYGIFLYIQKLIRIIKLKSRKFRIMGLNLHNCKAIYFNTCKKAPHIYLQSVFGKIVVHLKKYIKMCYSDTLFTQGTQKNGPNYRWTRKESVLPLI